MSLQGQLRDMPFGDLYSIITSQPRSGLLKIETKTQRASLFVEKGQPYRATVERLHTESAVVWLEGNDAVHQMSTWSEGSFDYIVLIVPGGPRNIWVDGRELMLENLFKKEEFYQPAAPQPANPGEHLVQTKSGYRAKVASLDLNVAEWNVLFQVDDCSNVAEIARQLGNKVATVWQTLKQLEKFGLVDIYTKPLLQASWPAPSRPMQPRREADLSGGLAGMSRPAASSSARPRRGILGTIMAKIRSL